MKFGQPYSNERAQEEADQMASKIKAGEASDYDEAEAAVERERAERVTELEKIIDARLQQVIMNHFQKTNEGNAGIIMKVNFGQIPPDVVEWLAEQGIELRENQAAKILKFYSKGSAKQEFELQLRAYECLRPYADDPTVAQVPRPHFWRDMKVSDTTRAFLKSQGVTGVGESMEVIMMDYVPGEDLATAIFKDILRRKHWGLDSSGDLREDLREGNFAQLASGQFSALGYLRSKEGLDWQEFEADPSKRLSPDQIRFEEERVQNENERKMIDWLYEFGFELHPGVIKQIENTMDILHANGIVWRDGHHRNFMIDGPLFGKDGAKTGTPARVMIIDFGGSAPFEGKYEEVRDELYRGHMLGKGYADDFAVSRNLKKLTVPVAERKNTVAPQAKEYRAKLNERLRPMMNAKPSRFLEHLERLEKAAGGKLKLDEVFESMPGKDEFKFDGGLIALTAFVERGSITADTVREYLTNLKASVSEERRKKIDYFLETM